MENKQIEKLNREIGKIRSILSDLNVSEEILEREVKIFGNGAHIVLPKHHVNKKVKIIVG